jgi:hypothetical protein
MGVPFQQSIFGPETAGQRAPCLLKHCHGVESNGPKFMSFSMHVTVSLSKFSCTVTALILKHLSECNSCDSSVSIAPGYGLDNQGFRV